MSFWSKFGNVFKSIGKILGPLVGSALEHASVMGLTGEIVKIAYDWVKVAANQTLDNSEKREFVVKILVQKGVPESIARLAVELAVQQLKKEVAPSVAPVVE